MMYHFFFFCPMCTMQYSNNYTNFRQNEFSSIHRRLVQVHFLNEFIVGEEHLHMNAALNHQLCHRQLILRNYQRQFDKSHFLACVLVRSLLVKAYLESATVVLCPHIYKSVKVFQIDDLLVFVFPMEATLTSRLCHSSLPWLYGITEHGPRKMLVLSFHGIDDKSCTLHKALNYDSE